MEYTKEVENPSLQMLLLGLLLCVNFVNVTILTNVDLFCAQIVEHL